MNYQTGMGNVCFAQRRIGHLNTVARKGDAGWSPL